MTPYISTQSITSSLRQTILRLQADLASGQKELATGTQADIGLALGGQTGDSLLLQAATSRLQTIIGTNQTVSTRLSTTENILGKLQTSAQDLLNALVEGDGSTFNASTIRAIGETGLKGLIGALNTALNGDCIFGGTSTSKEPVADYFAPAAANKAAVDSAFGAAFGFTQTSASVSGITGPEMQQFLDAQFAPLFEEGSWSSIWSSASDQTLTSQISPNLTTDTSVTANETAFRQLAQAYTMIADLGTPALASDAYQAVTGSATRLLTSAISNLVDMQAGIGLVRSKISSATSEMSLQMDILSTRIGNLENINPYEAQTRVANLQTQIQASYSLTSQLQRLSLVEYL